MNFTLEEAYREACLALGETIVRERLLISKIQGEPVAEPEPEKIP